jgi:hypothetical protein
MQKQETGIQTTSQKLQGILQLATEAEVPALLAEKVDHLQAKRFDQASRLMPSTIQMAVQLGVPMISVQVASKQVVPFIEYELIRLMAMVNVDQRLNIQKHQIPVIAQELYETFKTESIEDIAVCFKRGAMGTYGEIYRLDGAVIAGWMRAYLEEKYSVIESNLNSEKLSMYQVKRTEKPEINPGRNLLAALETVIAGKDPGIDLSKHLTPEELKEVEEARKKGLKIPDKSNAQENEYQRHRLQVLQERKAFQDKLYRTASDFYEKKGGYSGIKAFEDDKGFYVLAENQADAEQIYAIATKPD